VIESDIQGGIINAGNPETVKIKDVARLIKQKLESAGALNFGAVAYRADQVMNLKVKSETLLGLGWCPEILIDQGIEQTIDWLFGRPEKPLFNKSNQAIFFQIPRLLL
jgi:nucleoside-diphosphate-sugar epimerase